MLGLVGPAGANGNGPRARRQPPVLMYHRLTARTGSHPLSLAVRRFGAQLALLRALGYRSVSPVALATGDEWPARAVAITFDDGYLDTLTAALPLLRHYGFTATCYVVAGAVGGVSDWTENAPLMDWNGLRAWLRAGMEVGAHSMSHPDLTGLAAPALREELTASRARLEDRLGVGVRSFAYPFNRVNARVIEAARDAGYAAACAGIDVHPSPHALTRVDAARESWIRFGLQLSPAYPGARRVYRALVPRRG
jgi:peptidoglycan/xylan/chitin deacetylase (PgdA/CDA1 family)